MFREKVFDRDPLLNAKLKKMYNDILEEVSNPLWQPPEGVEITGNPPPEVIAQMMMIFRLHMSGHEN